MFCKDKIDECIKNGGDLLEALGAEPANIVEWASNPEVPFSVPVGNLQHSVRLDHTLAGSTEDMVYIISQPYYKSALPLEEITPYWDRVYSNVDSLYNEYCSTQIYASDASKWYKYRTVHTNDTFMLPFKMSVAAMKHRRLVLVD